MLLVLPPLANPPPVGETRSVKNQTPPLTFEISLHAGQAHDLLSLGRRGIVDEGWRDTFGGRDAVHRKGHSQLNEHWIKRDRLGGRTGMGDAKGGRAGWRGAAVGKDHEINMYVGGCGPRGSGVASNWRLLIGQRPPHGHAHSHTRCLKASTKRQPPYIPWWTATAKQRDAGGGWMHDANTLYPANTVTEFGGIIENWKPAWLVLSFSLSSYRRIFWGTTNPPRFPFWVYSGVIWLNGYWSVGRTVRILENSREQVFGG